MNRSMLLLAGALALGAAPAHAGLIQIDFSPLANGASVEGLGTVHPLLSISAPKAVGVAVRAGVDLPAQGGLPSGRVHVASTVPGPLVAGDPGIIHGHVGPKGGFADNLAVGGAVLNRGPNDFSFGFAPGWYAKSFSVTMLDFGDNNPSRATYGKVTWTAFDKDGNVVDEDWFEMTIDTTSSRINYNYSKGTFTPKGGATIDVNPQQDSDASVAVDATGIKPRPGAYTFNLSGDNIARVAVSWENNGASWVDGANAITAINDQPFDPKIAFTGLAFNFETVPTPASLGLFALALATTGLARRRSA